MEKVIQKHYVSSFYIITMIFSFCLLPLNLVFKSVENYSVFFTQFAPSLAVVFIAILIKDKSILYEMKNRIYLQGCRLEWLIPAIFIPAVCVSASRLVMTIFNITYVSWKGNILFYILNIAAMLVGCYAEEIGWRGFLLPHLQKRYSSFFSSIIVGVACVIIVILNRKDFFNRINGPQAAYNNAKTAIMFEAEGNEKL